ncbi:MAG: hypothetical protein R2861_01295 [Desulfobacterales bacterium]
MGQHILAVHIPRKACHACREQGFEWYDLCHTRQLSDMVICQNRLGRYLSGAEKISCFPKYVPEKPPVIARQQQISANPPSVQSFNRCGIISPPEFLEVENPPLRSRPGT